MFLQKEILWEHSRPNLYYKVQPVYKGFENLTVSTFSITTNPNRLPIELISSSF